MVHRDSLVLLCRQEGSQRLLAGILVVLEQWLLQCPLALHQHHLYNLVVPTLRRLHQVTLVPDPHSSLDSTHSLSHSSRLGPLFPGRSRVRLF